MIKIGSIIIGSLVAFSAFASVVTKPERCPSIEAIRNANLEDLVSYQGGSSDYWYIDIYNHFDTNQQWNFIVAQVYAKDKNDASKKVRNALNKSVLNTGPIESNKDNTWVCIYSGSIYNVMAITVN